ncbi:MULTISPECIES: hypothetical protein [unclassified Martelella]|uniref:hypothetical protein n=1 Tax=unclassified Martelella TaxID=2629616 RepID=UPI0025BE1439|nr:hypothetical protein [Martelella sp.]|tara:strand:- start:587 stop:1117 length:531 start_codon:yes stop_codon:yes gene_type:complete
MNILPSCSIKSLTECEPSQLVRLVEYGEDAGALALVADVEGGEDARALIQLNEDIPAYSIINDPDRYQVLAFEAPPTLVVDPFSGFDASPSRLFEAQGCVMRHHDCWVMRVNEYYGSGFRPRQGSFDLESGRLINPVTETRRIAYFGKWHITVPNPDGNEKAITVASFEWKAPQNS